MFFKITPSIRRRFILITFFIFTVFTLYFLKGFFPVILSPVDRFTSSIISFPQQLFVCLWGEKSLIKEYRDLEIQIQKLKLEIDRLEYIKKENEILRSYLKFKTDYGINKFVIGKVVGFSGSGWLSSFRIDVGQDEGVKKGDLVIYDGTLVGMVEVVYPNSSIVLTVGDKNFRLTTRTKKTGELCLYQGFNQSSGYLKYVRPEQDIRVGDIIVTETMSPNIPAGIPVGMVKHISQKEGEFFRSVEISLFYRQEVLDYVMVISR